MPQLYDDRSEDIEMLRDTAVEQLGWIENAMKELQAKYSLTTSSWDNAPSPGALSSTQITREQNDEFWGPYGSGKLCQQDSNARSGLRKKKNSL